MPLFKGKENIGKNVKTEEAAGKPKAQAVAIALREAGVPKAKDVMPNAEDGSFSANDLWTGSSS